jgi:hypothetical protein
MEVATVTDVRRCRDCEQVLGELGVEYERLLRIMRLVSRHPAYRERVRELESNRPDDLWYDHDLGWAVTYRMTEGRTLGFAISGPEEVTAESRVYRAYECREL